MYGFWSFYMHLLIAVITCKKNTWNLKCQITFFCGKYDYQVAINMTH